jgi:hypothetical protein
VRTHLRADGKTVHARSREWIPSPFFVGYGRSDETVPDRLAPPKVAISELMGRVKGQTATRVFMVDPNSRTTTQTRAATLAAASSATRASATTSRDLCARLRQGPGFPP